MYRALSICADEMVQLCNTDSIEVCGAVLFKKLSIADGIDGDREFLGSWSGMKELFQSLVDAGAGDSSAIKSSANSDGDDCKGNAGDMDGGLLTISIKCVLRSTPAGPHMFANCSVRMSPYDA